MRRAAACPPLRAHRGPSGPSPGARVGAGTDEPAVGLQLALAGSAGADPAARPRQVRPQPSEARQLVLELGQLDLEAALVGLGMEGKDVEDQPAAIDDLDIEEALEGL